MIVQLTRKWFTDRATEGDVFLDGAHVCWSLEDRARRPGEPKIAGQTAIPPGRYPLEWRWSPRFQRDLLGLREVPDFSGILIHAGTRSQDTEGCILVGLARTDPTDDWIGQSALALATLEAQVVPRLAAGESVVLELLEAPEIDERE